MRTYMTKQESRVLCDNCGRVYIEVINGVIEGGGAEGCPHCTLLLKGSTKGSRKSRTRKSGAGKKETKEK